MTSRCSGAGSWRRRDRFEVRSDDPNEDQPTAHDLNYLLESHL